MTRARFQHFVGRGLWRVELGVVRGMVGREECLVPNPTLKKQQRELGLPLEAFMHECMHAFIHQALNPYFAPGTVLGAGDAAVKETSEAPVLTQ